MAKESRDYQRGTAKAVSEEVAKHRKIVDKLKELYAKYEG